MITRHLRKASNRKRAKHININKGTGLYRDDSRSRRKMYKQNLQWNERRYCPNKTQITKRTAYYANDHFKKKELLEIKTSDNKNSVIEYKVEEIFQKWTKRSRGRTQWRSKRVFFFSEITISE